MSSSERIRLQAQAHDALTEVLVTNSQFDRVARGFGSVTIELDPGVHRVEFRTGTQAEEKYVVLRSGELEHRVLQESPAAAARFDPHSAELMRTWSRRALRGVQARIGVFSAGGGVALAGAKVLTASGRDGSDGHARHEEGAVSAVVANVTPGAHLLFIPALHAALPLHVPHGWAAHVMLSGSGIADAIVVLRQLRDGLDPEADDYRQIEVLRGALALRRRGGSPPRIAQLEGREPLSPMVGLLAAHLQAIATQTDAKLVESLCAATAARLGAHPDVIALRLRLGVRPQDLTTEEQALFGATPLLVSSWRQLVAASAADARVVPTGSAAAALVERMRGDGCWLVVGLTEPLTAEARTTRATSTSHADLVALLETIDPEDPLSDPELTPLARTLGRYLQVAALDRAGATGGLRERRPHSARQTSVRELLSDERLVTALGAPRAAIEQAATRLLDREGATSALGTAAGFSTQPTVHPDDPHKGRFGGSPDANGRRLRATVSPVAGDPDWFDVVLIVESTDAAQPLKGMVELFLHPTFPDPNPRRPVRKGCARWRGYAWGAFTVGARCDRGATTLELDLAELPGVPSTFRER